MDDFSIKLFLLGLCSLESLMTYDAYPLFLCGSEFYAPGPSFIWLSPLDEA